MDLVGYAALGGLERVAIVAGAVIIGYWGYRLYTAGKSAGLVFMGLAVLVLVGTLATGSSHVKSIGEGYQLASAPRVAPEPPAAPAPEPLLEPADSVTEGVAASEPSPFRDPIVEVPAETTAEAPVASPGEAPVADTPELPEVESPPRLATGQELGGRIVSVKSENVSLEWSTQ